MSKIKVPIYLIILFFVSAGLAEIFSNKILCFPKYGIEKRILDIRKSGDVRLSDIYRPYARYFTTENGYSLHRRNNIGLTGSDVAVSDTSKYIFVMGSSVMLAEQMEADKIATSVFQNELGRDSKYQVINLGERSHDLYDNYFRLKYFEKIYKPSYIIIVLEKTYTKWLKRHPEQLDFSLSGNFGKVFESKAYSMEKPVRENLSFANLLVNGMKAFEKISTDENGTGKNEESNFNKEMDDYLYLSNNFYKCLEVYSREYGKKFMLVSIMNNPVLNNELNNYCVSAGISFNYDNTIFKAENRIKKMGHLTEEGNSKLGKFLYDSFAKKLDSGKLILNN